MNFPVLVEAYEDQFAASLVGEPDVRVVGPTRSQAIVALKAHIRRRVEHGELSSVEIEDVGVSTLAGKYAADPTLHEICEEAYELRDRERDG